MAREIQYCTTIKRDGCRCTAPANFYNVLKEEYYCSRHNKIPAEMRERMRSIVLCHYGRDGLPLDDLEAPIEDDPVGEAYVKKLNGYINVRYGRPLQDHDEGAVFISEACGFGPHFTRRTLAQALSDSMAYMISRPDAYECIPGVGLHNIRIMRIEYSTYYGHFVAVMRKVDDEPIVIDD